MEGKCKVNEAVEKEKKYFEQKFKDMDNCFKQALKFDIEHL